MDIAPFIRELIVLNECVILRGIGGFETSYKHATVDKKQKIIIPPSKKIKFRPDLVKDNGVLMSYIADKLGISKGKASSYIDKFVSKFFDEIKEKEKVFLEGIGEFTFDNRNNIIFTEIENANYLAESFGLEVLDFNGDIKENTPILEAKSKTGGSKKGKYKGLYISIGVLFSLIVISILLLIATSKQVNLIHWFDDKSADKNNGTMIFGNTDKELEDSIISAIERSLSESTIPNKALAVPTAQASTKKAETKAAKSNYYLVAGSFQNIRNAEILKDQLKRKGLSPEIVITNEQLYRIVVGAFYDRKEAIAELRRIRGQLDQSVWLLEKNN